MKKEINNNWSSFLNNEFKKDYFIKLEDYVDSEYKNNIIFPKEDDIYNAFKYADINEIKVVILGQDPYHNYNEAMGLSFSVNEGVKVPPSLKNIFKELNDDLNINRTNTNFINLAREGVFFLNTTLTVRLNEPLSHYNKGWEIFTDNVIRYIEENDNYIVYILWGNNARSKKKLITNKNHLVIESAHPSPLSSYHGFFGSKPFSKANNYLVSKGISPIDWSK